MRPSGLIKSEGKHESFNLKQSKEVGIEANINN